MVAVAPGLKGPQDEWSLPDSHALESDDVFAEPNWREAMHTDRLMVAEEREEYGTGSDA